jgi:hypothetical protein
MLRVWVHVCVMLTSLHHVEQTLECSEFNVTELGFSHRTRFLFDYHYVMCCVVLCFVLLCRAMNISGVLDPKLQTSSVRIRRQICSVHVLLRFCIRFQCTMVVATNKL